MGIDAPHAAAIQRSRPLLIAAFICVAALLCAGFELGASRDLFSGLHWGLVVITAFLFNGITLGLRSLVTKISSRTFLIGRMPFALGLVKLTGVVVVLLLIVCLLASLIAGSPFREIAVRAVIAGVITSATLSFAANGLMNVFVLVRHFRGTLLTTSRSG
jgi:hypothetical protein